MQFFTRKRDYLLCNFTTNYYGKELINRFDDKDFAEPLIRRIRESNRTINLKK